MRPSDVSRGMPETLDTSREHDVADLDAFACVGLDDEA
jgi:hypothetical protein